MADESMLLDHSWWCDVRVIREVECLSKVLGVVDDCSDCCRLQLGLRGLVGIDGQWG